MAVLELPPSKPDTRLLNRPHKLAALTRYRGELRRWRKAETALGGVSVPFREVSNGPAQPGQKHGTGTLLKPSDARITDCSIVHTNPNRAMRRAAGGRSISAQRRKMLQLLAAAEAREQIAAGYRVRGRWHPAEPGSIARLGELSIGDLFAWDRAA